VLALAELDFIERKQCVHFLGPPGTGKSHLAIALGFEAVKAGKSVFFATLAELVDSLRKAEREGKLRERVKFLSRYSLLIVDEIGYLPLGSGGGNLFFQLVNAWLRAQRHGHDQQPRLRRMGRDLRRCRRRHRLARSATAPRRGHPHRGQLVPPARARRPRPRDHANPLPTLLDPQAQQPIKRRPGRPPKEPRDPITG